MPTGDKLAPLTADLKQYRLLNGIFKEWILMLLFLGGRGVRKQYEGL